MDADAALLRRLPRWVRCSGRCGGQSDVEELHARMKAGPGGDPPNGKRELGSDNRSIDYRIYVGWTRCGSSFLPIDAFPRRGLVQTMR